MSRADHFDVDAALDRIETDPECTAALLFAEAEQQFAERGFESTTVRGIADAVGVNVSTLHFHWPSKQLLYRAVMWSFARQYRAYALRLAAELQKGPPREQLLDSFVDWTIELQTSRPAIARLLLRRYSGVRVPGDDDLEWRVEEMQLMSGALGTFAPVADGALDPMLFVLSVFFFSLVIFSESDVQKQLLGGSLYSDGALRERLKRFTRHWFKRMLLDAE